MSLTREQALIEYAKCVKSTPYALRTYLQTYDNTAQRFVPLDLFSDQIQLVNDYDEFEENIALKYRQAGVSTVTAAWSSKKLVFAKNLSLPVGEKVFDPVLNGHLHIPIFTGSNYRNKEKFKIRGINVKET